MDQRKPKQTRPGGETRSSRGAAEGEQPKPDLEGVPDAAGLKGNEKIEAVDLSLHGDAINHWQDEPDIEGREHPPARDSRGHKKDPT